MKRWNKEVSNGEKIEKRDGKKRTECIVMKSCNKKDQKMKRLRSRRAKESESDEKL